MVFPAKIRQSVNSFLQQRHLFIKLSSEIYFILYTYSCKRIIIFIYQTTTLGINSIHSLFIIFSFFHIQSESYIARCVSCYNNLIIKKNKKIFSIDKNLISVIKIKLYIINNFLIHLGCKFLYNNMEEST